MQMKIVAPLRVNTHNQLFEFVWRVQVDINLVHAEIYVVHAGICVGSTKLCGRPALYWVGVGL